jgi:hypothetical protein
MSPSSNTGVSLPILPEGREFEEFLAAYFQAHGLYVERHVTDRQQKDILEIDFITTKYEQNHAPIMCLHEVKSGDWGFSDIFKIRGWIDYLNLETGILLAKKAPDHPELYNKIANQLNVQVVTIPDLSNAANQLAGLISPEKIEPADIEAWRFSYWVERNLLRRLTELKKTVQGRKGYSALDSYAFTIISRTFFTRNVIDRAYQLYEAYQSHPDISAKLSHEASGKDFSGDYKSLTSEDYKNTYYECTLTDTAISTFVEHRARLELLKSAVDYMLNRAAGDDHSRRLIHSSRAGRSIGTLDCLPVSFRDALTQLAAEPYFHRYPIFWQWFLWVFGGFILNDYQQKEFELLSRKTGIPPTEIPRALRSYEILFPSPKGWLLDLPKTSIRAMKLFSTPFMGVGANFRRWHYCPNLEFDELNLTGPYTKINMLKWNNATLAALRTNKELTKSDKGGQVPALDT